ncbi:hypothetical protein RFI_11142 [Reticulomyxa filosa]|uniref:Uncharacterized protein n=1 Tax=Reticulomyxa filosa TaxID=46433 RepID=X6NJ30_RETFI|nr:hypothetical protein RFI_11142 [Reticulomyxa filosa]|eukprot:ETO25996.1 hypothetical protein RFI_11142 [Reticulomyxa filosa]
MMEKINEPSPCCKILSLFMTEVKEKLYIIQVKLHKYEFVKENKVQVADKNASTKEQKKSSNLDASQNASQSSTSRDNRPNNRESRQQRLEAAERGLGFPSRTPPPSLTSATATATAAIQGRERRDEDAFRYPKQKKKRQSYSHSPSFSNRQDSTIPISRYKKFLEMYNTKKKKKKKKNETKTTKAKKKMSWLSQKQEPTARNKEENKSKTGLKITSDPLEKKTNDVSNEKREVNTNDEKPLITRFYSKETSSQQFFTPCVSASEPVILKGALLIMVIP